MRKFAAYYPALVFLAGSAFVWHTHAQVAVPLAAPLGSVLSGLEGYSVQDQKVSDDERRIAGMSDYVARMYTRDSVIAFTTYVGYYDRQTQGRTIHSPRNCLPGAGWEILTAGTREVDIGGVKHVLNRNVLKNGNLTAVVYYWYQGRGRVVANEYRVKWNLLRDAALLGHTEEALVRLIVPVPSDARIDASASTAAQARLDAFGDSLAARLINDVNRALPGAPTGRVASTH
jgi:EpsI family protein